MICFTCRATLPLTPAEIGAVILDLTNWSRFTGWGPLPGIRSAAFEHRPAGFPGDPRGTRVAVVNTDGSRHVEEIGEWDLPRTIRLRLSGFTRPLCWFAERFEEAFVFEELEAEGGEARTLVRREFELVARGWWGVPVLWMVRPMLRRAVRKSMEDMMGEAGETA